MEITDTKLAISLVAILGLTVFLYGYLTGNPVESGLVYTAIAAISGLAGYEIGKSME